MEHQQEINLTHILGDMPVLNDLRWHQRSLKPFKVVVLLVWQNSEYFEIHFTTITAFRALITAHHYRKQYMQVRKIRPTPTTYIFQRRHFKPGHLNKKISQNRGIVVLKTIVTSPCLATKQQDPKFKENTTNTCATHSRPVYAVKTCHYTLASVAA